MAKVNTIANNGLTIVENYNKLLEQFRKTKTMDDVRKMCIRDRFKGFCLFVQQA